MKSVTETATLSRLMGFVIALAAIFLAPSPAAAQFDTRSDGSDGAFNPTANYQFDLSQAASLDSQGNPARWDTPSPVPLKGVYDKDQWIIVFKFTSVNIPSGVTVTFKNHPSNPPVVWLVQGAVTIAGTLNLNGSWNTTAGSKYPLAGPGGFRGGRAFDYWTKAFGPGASLTNANYGGATSAYMNPGCFPLVGGSGASDGAQGGGGGAILIAAGVSVSIPGQIQAFGGAYSASGGMVRIAAPDVSGAGTIIARAWSSEESFMLGRVRIEASTVNLPPTIPMYSSGPLGTQIKFLRDDFTPAVRVVSVGGVAAPADPQARFELPGEVVVATRSVQAVIECRNVPTNSTVKVYFRSASNGGTHTVVNATLQSGNQALSTWVATGDLGAPAGYSTVQAHVILPTP